MGAKEFVADLFARWEKGDSGPFFAAMAPDMVWTAKGSTPISGTYRGKAEYLDKCYKPLLGIFSGPTRCTVRRILADGQWVVVEWHGDTPTAAGPVYANDYCWLICVSPKGDAIAEVVGYFDSVPVNALFPARAGSAS